MGVVCGECSWLYFVFTIWFDLYNMWVILYGGVRGGICNFIKENSPLRNICELQHECSSNG